MLNKVVLVVAVITIFSTVFLAEPSFNGNSPGCAGSGCHTLQSGIVTLTPLSNLQIRARVNGVNSGEKIAGELVDSNNNVVDVVNSVTDTAIILTAQSPGQYTVNAGYKRPSREYGSTTIDLTLTNFNIPTPSNTSSTFELYPNHPNPFNSETIIKFSMPKGDRVEVQIFDVQGKHIRTLASGFYNKGIHTLRWNGRDDDGLPVSSGIYLYQIKSGDNRLVKSMILSK